MTYLKWQDELESYLGTLSREERERIFSYFAEMYADKRDAGIPEKEIIEEFGAPYDAAKRILAENGDNEEPRRRESYEEPRRRENYEGVRQPKRTRREEEPHSAPPRNDPPPRQNYDIHTGEPIRKRDDYTWVFVLLCVIFAVPLFILIIAMAGVTVGFCVAPIAVIVSGFAAIGGAIGGVVAGGGAAAGASMAGLGLIIVGVGFILAPVFFGLVKLMWKAFSAIFNGLRRAFSGRNN